MANAIVAMGTSASRAPVAHRTTRTARAAVVGRGAGLRQLVPLEEPAPVGRLIRHQLAEPGADPGDAVMQRKKARHG